MNLSKKVCFAIFCMKGGKSDCFTAQRLVHVLMVILFVFYMTSSVVYVFLENLNILFIQVAIYICVLFQYLQYPRLFLFTNSLLLPNFASSFLLTKNTKILAKIIIPKVPYRLFIITLHSTK